MMVFKNCANPQSAIQESDRIEGQGNGSRATLEDQK